MTCNNISNIADFCTRNGNLTVCSLCRNITASNTAAGDSDAATSSIFSVCPESRSSDIRSGHLDGTAFGTEIAIITIDRTAGIQNDFRPFIIYGQICIMLYANRVLYSITEISFFCLYTKCPPHK